MALALNTVHEGDCLVLMREIPDNSVNLIVIDPPYNIGKDKRWDKWKKVDEYVEFMAEVFKECERVLKPNGSFYWFHIDMGQVRKLMDVIDSKTDFEFKNFIIWNKRYEGSRRKYYFDNVIKTRSNRSYRQLTEYCLFYTFQDDKGIDGNSFGALQNYFRECRERLGWTYKKCDDYLGIKASYCYWDKPTTHEYRIPTKEHYEKLQETGAFPLDYDSLLTEYETQRYTFNDQKTHHDVWEYEVAPKQGHVTPKPIELIENILLHSSNEGDVVLDCFLGSGTTAVAAINTGRQFIGIEREPEYVAIANQRITDAKEALKI